MKTKGREKMKPFDRMFYGTGAAEGIPDPFCRCPVCENARKKGGKEIRHRTMFRVNEELCIDLGADAASQATVLGDFTGLHHVLYTHTHEDHFCIMMLQMRDMATHRDREPLHVYLTDRAYDMVDKLHGDPTIIKGRTRELEEKGVFCFHQLHFGEETEIAGYRVLPLKGDHIGSMGENSANYLLTGPDGKTLYYGLDTGWYLPETLQALAGRHIDVLITECTFGLTPGMDAHPRGHLHAFALRELLDVLREQGTLDETSRVYATHINHWTSNHEQLAAYFAGQDLFCPFTVAWDGMQIPQDGPDR